MVSLRCKLLVQGELEKIGLNYTSINLGMVELFEDISPKQRALLKKYLLKSGLEFTNDKKAILIERIKNVVISIVLMTYALSIYSSISTVIKLTPLSISCALIAIANFLILL